MVVDFGTAVQPPYGEGSCAPGRRAVPLRTQVADLDGDTYDASWFVESMFDETHPALAVEGPSTTQSDFRVQGSGWDLTVLDLEVCEVVNGAIGECDDAPPAGHLAGGRAGPRAWPSSMRTCFPGRWSRWAPATARSTAPPHGTCAVVATETLRPAVSAWAALEYLTPVELAVDLAPEGLREHGQWQRDRVGRAQRVPDR